MSPHDIDVVVQRLDEHDKKLDKILDQATTTNGRVTNLEKWQSRVGGIIVGMFAVGLVADLGHRIGLFG